VTGDSGASGIGARALAVEALPIEDRAPAFAALADELAAALEDAPADR